MRNWHRPDKGDGMATCNVVPAWDPGAHRGWCGGNLEKFEESLKLRYVPILTSWF